MNDTKILLRDWLAGQALQALMSRAHGGEPNGCWYDPPGLPPTGHKDRGIDDNYVWVPERRAGQWARGAYALADAMLRAREGAA